MKKYYVIIVLCLATTAGFSQSQSAIRDTATDPKAMENSAKADLTLSDKKTITTTTTTTTTTEKRKKPRREKVHKECSRMKS